MLAMDTIDARINFQRNSISFCSLIFDFSCSFNVGFSIECWLWLYICVTHAGTFIWRNYNHIQYCQHHDMIIIEDAELWIEDAELWIFIHYVLIFLLGSNTIIVLKNVTIISILDSIIICVLTKNILG